MVLVTPSFENLESFVGGGPTFLVDKGREDPNITISGPSWRFAGVSMMTQH